MTHRPLMLKWFLYTQLCLNVLSSYRWAKHVPCMFSFFHLFDFGNTFIHWMHIHVELCIWLTCHLSQMFIKYNSHIKSCNPYLDCYGFCNCIVHCIALKIFISLTTPTIISNGKICKFEFLAGYKFKENSALFYSLQKI